MYIDNSISMQKSFFDKEISLETLLASEMIQMFLQKERSLFKLNVKAANPYTQKD